MRLQRSPWLLARSPLFQEGLRGSTAGVRLLPSHAREERLKEGIRSRSSQIQKCFTFTMGYLHSSRTPRHLVPAVRRHFLSSYPEVPLALHPGPESRRTVGEDGGVVEVCRGDNDRAGEGGGVGGLEDARAAAETRTILLGLNHKLEVEENEHENSIAAQLHHQLRKTPPGKLRRETTPREREQAYSGIGGGSDPSSTEHDDGQPPLPRNLSQELEGRGQLLRVRVELRLAHAVCATDLVVHFSGVPDGLDNVSSAGFT